MKVDIERFHELVADRSVTIVGNAPTAVQFDHRARIERSDIIIRFNRFRLEGFSEFIGTKTDVVACAIGFKPALPSLDLLRSCARDSWWPCVPKKAVGLPPAGHGSGSLIYAWFPVLICEVWRSSWVAAQPLGSRCCATWWTTASRARCI